ncbi:acyltransferase [Flavobacteriaceae bacterium]|nr:acyltransferase [Flavobacteriaceae bacterium]
MIFKIGYILKLDIIHRKFSNYINRLKIIRINKAINSDFKFVPQGPGGVAIEGDLKKLKIHRSSHLKSNTFIECSGGVEIGRYLHVGRGLTIFSTNHNYFISKKIPYDETVILKPVIIEDFVWMGSNVTIVPGVKIGLGSVIGSGCVVTKNIPKYSVVGGNPSKVIKIRDVESFNENLENGRFF